MSRVLVLRPGGHHKPSPVIADDRSGPFTIHLCAEMFVLPLVPRVLWAFFCVSRFGRTMRCQLRLTMNALMGKMSACPWIRTGSRWTFSIHLPRLWEMNKAFVAMKMA